MVPAWQPFCPVVGEHSPTLGALVNGSPLLSRGAPASLLLPCQDLKKYGATTVVRVCEVTYDKAPLEKDGITVVVRAVAIMAAAAVGVGGSLWVWAASLESPGCEAAYVASRCAPCRPRHVCAWATPCSGTSLEWAMPGPASLAWEGAVCALGRAAAPAIGLSHMLGLAGAAGHHHFSASRQPHVGLYRGKLRLGSEQPASELGPPGEWLFNNNALHPHWVAGALTPTALPGWELGPTVQVGPKRVWAGPGPQQPARAASGASSRSRCLVFGALLLGSRCPWEVGRAHLTGPGGGSLWRLWGGALGLSPWNPAPGTGVQVEGSQGHPWCRAALTLVAGMEQWGGGSPDPPGLYPLVLSLLSTRAPLHLHHYLQQGPQFC